MALRPPKRPRPLVALLTDFGYQDWFAGVLKGVIKRICPEAQVADITHGIAPQDVIGGALALVSARSYFPDHTIFLAVVDPGVGTSRQPVIVRAGQQSFVGPNNGLFGLLARREPEISCRVIEPRRVSQHPPSATFHGRDIFAPAAALLAAGCQWTRITAHPAAVQPLPLADPVTDSVSATGEIIHFDRFGNAITSIEPEHAAHLPAPHSVRVGTRRRLPLRLTYADVPAGQPLAYWGSAGFLEIGVNCGYDQEQLRLTRGTRVILYHDKSQKTA
jgi:S-adenosylmethionine hydrolase